MSAKPTIALARWADTGGADKTAPSSGLRNTGFVEGTAADGSIVNELLFQLYSWALYLSDGVLTGAHSFGSTLEVVGVLTCDATAVVAGAVTIGGQLLSFADFTYTADNTTDQLAHTAHGLETGDGPVRTSNSGGGLPGGLAAATDYYAIKIDADHIKLAVTRSKAIGGVAIDITSNGTGTQTLLHQAGTTRVSDLTVTRSLAVTGDVTVGSDVTIGGDLDVGAIAAAGSITVGVNHDVEISGTGKYKRPARVRPIAVFSMFSAGGFYWDQPFADLSSSFPNLEAFVEVQEGETITTIKARVRCSTNAIAMKLFKRDTTGTGAPTTTQIGSTANSAGSSSLAETLTISGLSEVVGSGFVQYYLDFQFSGSGTPRIEGAWSTTTVA